MNGQLYRDKLRSLSRRVIRETGEDDRERRSVRQIDARENTKCVPMSSARSLDVPINGLGVYTLFHRYSRVRVGIVCGRCLIVFSMMMVCGGQVRLMVMGMGKSGKRKDCEIWMDVRKLSTWVVVVKNANLWQP